MWLLIVILIYSVMTLPKKQHSDRAQDRRKIHLYIRRARMRIVRGRSLSQSYIYLDYKKDPRLTKH